jgi:hypothetical protein
MASSRVARVLGIALVAVGVGSFLYHASASRTLRHLDVAAMYWLFISATVFSAGSFWPSIRARIEAHLGLFVAGTFVLAVCAACGRNVRVLGFKPAALSVATPAAATILTLALTMAAVRQRSGAVTIRVATSIVLFVIAVACQIGDRPGGWLCDPEAVVQAHAIWHVFSAAAFVIAVFVLDFQTKEGLKQAPSPTPRNASMLPTSAAESPVRHG